MKLLNLLKEVSTQTYNYGCVMLYFDFPKMEQIHNLIAPSDIYTEDEDKSFGLEDEPHCTLLYGLHEEVTLEEIKGKLKGVTYPTCKAHNPSLFENEKYDVLKFDIEGENLHKINEKLKEFPFTSDYPNYHPHMTVGYLKPGRGKGYTKLIADKFKDILLSPKYVVYSQPNGTKTKIKIDENI